MSLAVSSWSRAGAMFTMFMQYAAATWFGLVPAASSGWSTSERYMLVLGRML